MSMSMSMSASLTRLIVQGTFALLLLGSVLTWTVVLIKLRQRLVVRGENRRFLDQTGAAPRLAGLRALKGHRGPAWRLTQTGLAALTQAEAERDSGESPRDAVERALQGHITSERRVAESGLGVLASIGSTAPFVGLFGTVWGIIEALRAIGHSGSASLEVVAGPIGEALVATGVGIAVAVPAVLAYNYFIRGVKVQIADLEQHALEMLGAIARAAHPTAHLRVERPGFERREASI
jgi:biopolymer transport protein ExbB